MKSEFNKMIKNYQWKNVKSYIVNVCLIYIKKYSIVFSESTNEIDVQDFILASWIHGI